jgi:aryl-alcohol dehydrogenase-like predicted oxidoreductase
MFTPPKSRSAAFTKTGLRLSELGLGCYPFTDHWHRAAMNDRAIIDIIDYAISSGVNLIDTSEMHGNGHIESLIGKAMKGRRHKVAIVTKGGFTQHPNGSWGQWTVDASAANLGRAIDGSLKRLGVDYIDYYLSHFPDPHTPLEETLGALVQAQHEGKIVEFGLSNYTAEDIERALTLAPGLGTLQHHYSLLERSAEQDILPLSQRNGIILMVYRVLERGLLTGKPPQVNDAARNHYAMFQEPQLSQILQKVAILKEVARSYRRTPAQVALRWALARPEVTVALVGARSKAQLSEALGATGWKLQDQDVAYLTNSFASLT